MGDDQTQFVHLFHVPGRQGGTDVEPVEFTDFSMVASTEAQPS